MIKENKIVVEQKGDLAGILRVQLKDEKLKYSLLINLVQREYKTLVDNPDGDCFYIWVDGSKKAQISNLANDNPILNVDESNYRWLINCLH